MKTAHIRLAAAACGLLMALQPVTVASAASAFDPGYYASHNLDVAAAPAAALHLIWCRRRTQALPVGQSR